MLQLFIVLFFDWWEIQFDQVWSILDSGQIWSKKIKNKTILSVLSVNVKTFYSHIFWLVRSPVLSSLIKFEQVWSTLDRSDPKKSKTKQPLLFFLYKWQLFLVTFLDWWEIQFDQVWSILDRSDPKKSKVKQPF